MGDCYCRKTPLKAIIQNETVLTKIEQCVLDTNNVVRETYQFVRLYFLTLLEQENVPPLIDRTFLKGVFSTISNRKKSSRIQNLLDQLQVFYTEHYEPIQTIKAPAVQKDILDYEITGIITNVENHIKNSFFTYVNSLVYALCPTDKTARKNLRDDMYKGTFSSPPEYFHLVEEFSPMITEALKVLKTNPQKSLPLLYKISKLLARNGFKHKSILPLRRSLIPSYITIDKNICSLIFKDIEDCWVEIEESVLCEVGCKEGYSLTSIKTDGVACSLTFRTEKRGKRKKTKAEEKYLEDLNVLKNITGKKVVGIDPNKGNLVYCFDGENVLRYTQDERRNVSKKAKYKNIRKEQEENVLVRGLTDSDFHSVEKDLEQLSSYDSRSCSSDEFKEYLKVKNQMASRFGDVIYQEKIFRKLKWNTKINLKRSEDKFVSRFRETYGSDVVIAFGDWEERPGFLRGKEPTKGKSMRGLLRKAGYDVYLIDEFRTSKMCHVCHSPNECNFVTRNDSRPWKRGEKQRVWGLLRCTNGSCRRVHNRDFNSASNILFIAKKVIGREERPKVFLGHFKLVPFQ